MDQTFVYEIIWSSHAASQLEKLEKKVVKAIVKKLESVQRSPFRHLKKLKGFPFHRLRVGDYRIILQIENHKMVIFVIEVGHRKNIYKG